MTRQGVIRRIVERDNQKLCLCDETVRREAADLYESACDHFGTWGTALQYAGVDLQQLARERRYCAEAVKREIRRMSRGKYNLTSKWVRCRDPRLHAAALRHFETWKEAVRAAGIDPDHIRPYTKSRSMNRKQILMAIRKRQRQGRSLRCCDVLREDYTFVTSARNRFGSWRMALVAAGVGPDGTGSG